MLNCWFKSVQNISIKEKHKLKEKTFFSYYLCVNLKQRFKVKLRLIFRPLHNWIIWHRVWDINTLLVHLDPLNTTSLHLCGIMPVCVYFSIFFAEGILKQIVHYTLTEKDPAPHSHKPWKNCRMAYAEKWISWVIFRASLE